MLVNGHAFCIALYALLFSFSQRTEIRDETTLTHQADNQNLDDSADFCYGTKNLDSKSLEMFVENERSNFRLLLQRVCHLFSVYYPMSVWYLVGFSPGRCPRADHPWRHVQHHP